MFTWIPFYTELAKKIIAYRDRQEELIRMLKEMEVNGLPIVSILDHDQEENEIPLGSIDPFTFYACFNRALRPERKQRILTYLKPKFELQSPVPEDFEGIPVVNNLAAWFFPYFDTRQADDIPSLWALAESVVNDEPEKLEGSLFDRCLQIETVGPAKLTMGMFWLSPKSYIAVDKRNLELFEQNGINVNVKDFSSYLILLKEVIAKLGTNYPEISWKAYQIVPPPPNRQYWAGGFRWGEISKLEEFIQGNYWQIGWPKNEANPAAKKTWDFFHQIKVGDEFAIKGYGGRNDLRVRYLGEVVEKLDEGIIKLKKINRPLYSDKGPTGLKGASWFDTLVPIRAKPIVDAIFHGEQPPTEIETEATVANLILYGPPGTGKTYETIDRAVRIIEPNFSGDRPAYKLRFDQLAREGRIGFITFHQSYSYEDFVEGIRPVLDAEEETDVPRYECRSGIFKRLAVNALFDSLEKAEATKQQVPFDVLWIALLSKIESEPDAKYPGLTERTSYQLNLTPRGNIEGDNVLTNKKFLCSRKVLQEVFDAKRNQDSITASEVMEVVGRGCHSHLVAAVFNELKRLEILQFRGKMTQEGKTTHTEEGKAKIVQRFLTDGEKSGYQMKPESQWNRYVLVIDEINRGNLSKILGELITLIEDDKRLPAENGQIVTLPYSGEKFAVPVNLCLVATMNTADKSIALVDLALRRRFEFKELCVDLSVCKSLNDKMRSALKELNRRITLRKDRDHQIGHAYFVSVANEEEFNQQFRKHIIPLLQEYFYNDWEGLRYVLGENSNSDGNFIRKIDGAEAREARTKWQWFFDKGPDALDCLQTLCSNYQID